MLKYLKPYWYCCVLAPLFMLGEITMDMLQPAMMAVIVDDGMLGGNLPVILSMGLKMVLLIVFGGTTGILCGVFANTAAQRVGNDIRKDLFGRIMDLSFRQTDRFTTGSPVTRITNDVTQVEQMVMMSMRSIVRCSVMFVGGIVMLYLQSPRFALVVACGLPFLAAFVILFLRKVSPLFTVIQQKLDALNCLLQENIAGARVVKAYVKEADSLRQFGAANDELCDINLRAQSMLAFLNPCVNIVLNLCVVAVLYLGGVSVRTDGAITPGQIMASLTYLSLILMRVIFMANIFQTFTRASASWRRIREVLDTAPEQRDGTTRPADSCRGRVEFSHVDFAYPDAPDHPVLQDLSFTVEPGETVAIIGATGSGKTSLVQLIPRFYDVSAGTVRVDGVDVRDFARQDLRQRIGIVQQKAELFSRSIAENIRWGRPEADDEAVAGAARIAQAEDFILRTPAGFETPVTEGGHSLSGGQKQRLSIARAVLKRPEILIFDDSGSALDLRTEAALYDALDAAFAGTTRLIVAQRIASVQRADRILVLDNGRLCAEGTHRELLATSPVYQAICRSQLKKEVTAS